MQKDGVWNFEVSCPEVTAEKVQIFAVGYDRTEKFSFPELMLKAYCEGGYDGNLLDYIGINRQDVILDNKAFPEELIQSGIAQSCALNCTECGKCNEILKRIQKQGKSKMPAYSFTYSLTEQKN